MPTLTPVEHDPFGSPQFGFVPVDHDPWADAPQSGAEQWRSAINEYKQRQLRAPSMGQQIMDIAGNTGKMLAAPLMAGPRLMGDVASGAVDPNSPEAIRRSADVALNTAGMGVMGAERGAFGIFGGQLAKTADLDALARAQKMAEAGSHPNDIWNQTGWFQGADNKWRFEIPDKKARLTPSVAERFKGRNVGDTVDFGPAAEIMRHPDLYAAYPDLAALDTSLTKGGGYPYTPSGAFNAHESGAQSIALDSHNLKEARSLNLHELQHAVQNREGFTGGSSPREAHNEIVEKWKGELNQLNDKIEAGEPLNEREQAALNWFKTGAYNYPSSGLVMDKYRSVAGEVEARNVSARMNMTPQERQAKPPWTTEDVPREQQIVRGDSGGPQMSAPQAIVQKRGENNFLVKSPDNPDNRLAMVVEPDAVRVKTVDVRRANRNAGVGVSLYEKAIAFAAERGLPLRSDVTVTNDALHVYDALRRRGYDVTETPGTTTSAAGKSNEKHVFEVRGIPRPQRASSGIRLEPVDHDPFAQ